MQVRVPWTQAWLCTKDFRRKCTRAGVAAKVAVPSNTAQREPLKLALSVEAKAWKLLLCQHLNEEYKKKMSNITQYTAEYLNKLSRPIRDLDDVRFAMEALSNIRDDEIMMDMTLGPIEEAYSILNKYGVPVTKEETEGVDTLRYSFNKMQTKAVSV
ncbi:hypothetical protein NDU88_001002 [Pleurodeles waltl]|uniref:Dynein axonemal heavy chain 2/5/8 coiled-coil domain-containing protein n=1 Tax=Pleurodeles waltl TaxID=8319 RepID=A0AAV7R7C2_PLEWA|nr:hypothetical protein NDU88_001002 [Pleurodeles waltl]